MQQFFLFLSCCFGLGLFLPSQQKLKPTIVYLPFVEGRQLIVFDYEQAWHWNNYQMDLKYPRATLWSMHAPPHPANVLLVRDSLGQFLDTFNFQGQKIKKRKLLSVSEYLENQTGVSNRQSWASIFQQLPGAPNGSPQTHFRIYHTQSTCEGPPPLWDWSYPDHSDLKGYPTGLVDSAGRVVIDPIYQYICPAELGVFDAQRNWVPSSTGRFIVAKEGLYGVISADQEIVIPCKYRSLRRSKDPEGLLLGLPQGAEGKEVMLDFSGNLVEQ